jgi:ketosteroid isomerase-like protein
VDDRPVADGALESVVRDFADAAADNDLVAMESLMTDDFVGYITTDTGGVRAVDRAGYLTSIEAMDVGTADLHMEIVNATVVEPGRLLVMIEIHAARGGRMLHNFSGQLVRVVDGRISELWMVEALPATSAAFWAATD